MAKQDKTRQLSIEQAQGIEHLLQGKSDAATAKAVNVSRQTVWTWRNDDPLFIAELNRQRSEMWTEAREYRLTNMKSPAYPRSIGPFPGVLKSHECFGNEKFPPMNMAKRLQCTDSSINVHI